MADYINKIRTTEGDKPVNYEALANKPNSLPNPNKIKFTGSVVAEYDGSSEVTVDIPNGASEEQVAQIQTNTNDISELKNKTSELKGDLSKTQDFLGYIDKNLLPKFDVNTVANGITITSHEDGRVSFDGTSTYMTYISQSIVLNKGKYVINGSPTDAASGTYHIMYVVNGTIEYNVGGKEDVIVISEDNTTLTVYLRCDENVTTNIVFEPMVREYGTPSGYVPYGEKVHPYKSLNDMVSEVSGVWSGKKINVIGDSIVQGYYGNFVNVIRDILHLSEARNYGIGGSCLASSSFDAQYTPVVLRYNNMDNDADIIIVHAGTNDFSAQVPLGEPNSTDITTFNGALNVVMNGLREKYPDKLIIFDSILHRYNDDALNIKVSEYRKAIEDRCYDNHILFYDCYKYSGFDFIKGYYDHVLTTDGLHPNESGAEILGRKLAGFIKAN